MVIGNGLIANEFKQYKYNDDVIIFASGVSNSKETNSKEFSREIDLLSKYFNSNSRLVYFSTCSVYDPSLSNSLYIAHKLNMERIIKENFKNYIIFRLPNVIGKCDNNHTSFNFFKNRIKKGLNIIVHEKATRYFIDSEDLGLLLPKFININAKEDLAQTINVVFDNKIYIKDLVRIMEELIGKKVVKDYIDMGSDYDVDGSYFTRSIPPVNSSEYNYNLIKKYAV